MTSPGRVFTETKQVIAGNHEYTSIIRLNSSDAHDTSTMTLSPYDSFDLLFDNEWILDDLNIRPQSPSTYFAVQLLYPNGGKLLFAASSNDFKMNAPGQNNNWYRLPKWTRLRISIVDGDNDVIFVSAIGR